MKVLIDTNVILDLLCDRKEFSADASRLFKLCEVKKLQGVVSALSIPNIVYIMRKELDGEKIREIINRLSMIFTIADLKATDIERAAALPMNDFEDALQSVCAARLKADYIALHKVLHLLQAKVLQPC